MNRFVVPLGLCAALTLAACGKVQEKAAEKMAEKAIESSLSKDGAQAKVDLAAGGVKIATTDASGKSTQLELGSAKIGEAELGLPDYPGAKPQEGASMRVSDGGGGTSLRVGLHSDDAHDKVAAFYRDKLKSMSEGKQFMDMSEADATILSLVDDKARSALQVHVAKAEKGTDIAIMATRQAGR